MLAQCHIFDPIDDANKIGYDHMFKLMSQEIIKENVQESILSTEEVGTNAFRQFVEQRIIGGGNMWDRMSKVKVLSWNTTAKDLKIKTQSDVTTLKATSSLFARMLLIARSSRGNIDLERVIGNHEFSHKNAILMQADGTLHPTTDKSSVIHLLEGMVHNENHETLVEEHPMTTLVIDGMTVVHEVVALKNFETVKDLAMAYVKTVDTKYKG